VALLAILFDRDSHVAAEAQRTASPLASPGRAKPELEGVAGGGDSADLHTGAAAHSRTGQGGSYKVLAGHMPVRARTPLDLAAITHDVAPTVHAAGRDLVAVCTEGAYKVAALLIESEGALGAGGVLAAGIGARMGYTWVGHGG